MSSWVTIRQLHFHSSQDSLFPSWTAEGIFSLLGFFLGNGYGWAVTEHCPLIAYPLVSLTFSCFSEIGIFMTFDVVSDFCVLVWDQLRIEHRTCAQLSSMLEHGCGCAFLQLAWKSFLVVPCWWLLHGFRLLIGELSFYLNETNYLGSSGKLWDAPNVVVVTFHRHIIISCSCSFLHGEDNEGFSVIVFLTSRGLDAGPRSQDSCGKCLRKRMIRPPILLIYTLIAGDTSKIFMLFILQPFYWIIHNLSRSLMPVSDSPIPEQAIFFSRFLGLSKLLSFPSCWHSTL